MSTNLAQGNNNGKVTISQAINDFLVRRRVIIISVLCVVLCVFIAIFTFTVVSDHKKTAAYETVEAVLADWDKARTADDKSGLQAKEDDLIKQLEKVANSNKNSYAGSRASMTIAEIYYSRKDWKNAMDNYLTAAKYAPKAYSSGLDYYNAGVCADEMGNTDDAIANFTKAFDSEDFALKPRALFSIGRIQEQTSKNDDAIATYQKLAEKYPEDEWTFIAKTRIITLQIKK
jgi:tetratricopeptide (TPR) repeat protein